MAMLFYYRARTDEGEEQIGTLEAPSRLVALKKLAAYGWQVDYCSPHPERIQQAASQLSTETLPRIFPLLCILRPAPQHMANFYSQLGSLLAAGVTAHECAAALKSRAPSAALRRAMSEIEPELAAGASLATQLSRYPQLFPPADAGLLRAAERSGDWEGICRELEDFYARAYKGLRWVLVARVYYAFLLVAIVLVPPMPWIIVRGGTWYLHLVFTRLLPALMLLASLWLGARAVAGLPAVRGLRDRLVLWLPILRGQELHACRLRFVRALLSLLHAGVEAGEALEVAGGAVGNALIAAQVYRAAEQLRNGASVEQVISGLPFLTQDQQGMLTTAFQAGRLEEGLRRLTEDAREALDRRTGLTRLTSAALLGIVMTVLTIVAVVVGWLSLYAAMAEKAGIGDLWQELLGK
jgi:type II secretory pathway component PulF